MSVILNEVCIGAGGDSYRPHVHTANELTELRHKRSNTWTFQAFDLDRGQPLALRAIPVIEAEPTLMEWRRISPHKAPRFCRDTTYCNLGPMLEHGLSPGSAIDSGRSGIFFSAALTPVTTKRYT